MKEATFIVVAFIVLFGGVWLLAANDLGMRKVFMPAHEQVRRETFEESKAYRDGMVQELRSMQFEYLKANEEQKKGLANVIRHKISGFPEEAIPSDLREFIEELP